ncbi:MAG: nuclear transport factor 2 family protein [Myxococcota bacterium]
MSAEKKLANAMSLYMEGIRDGRAKEALEKYLGDRYTQHSTGVADGKEGFLTFFLPFLDRNPVRDIRVVRSLVDGPHVFVHVHQNLNDGQYFYVTADIFDTDENDKIVEHWDTIQEEVRETKSGRSMVDGPTEIEDLDKTEANRTLLTAFMNDVLIGGQMERVGEFIAEDYRQHSPTAADGLVGLQELVASFDEFRYVKAHKILVQGNFAATLSHAVVNGDDWCIIDIFRMKDGKIVEHWDVQEKILPKDQWNNSGKF